MHRIIYGNNYPIRCNSTLLLLLWRYNSDRDLAFSTISFHLERSCTCSAHCISFFFFKSFLTSSSHLDLGLPAGLPVNGFHLCILFTVLISGILFVCPNQLNRWVLTQFIMFRLQQYTVYLCLSVAQHVSGGISIHHEELISLYLQ